MFRLIVHLEGETEETFVNEVLKPHLYAYGYTRVNPRLVGNARFIPYVMMHEFEGLLFSDCERFGRSIGRPELTPKFQAVRDRFTTPEEINDSPITAPSKRVEVLVDGIYNGLTRTIEQCGIAGLIQEEALSLRLEIHDLRISGQRFRRVS